MNHRTLGRTGIEVSEIGYGAWGIGQSMWLGADDDESLRALNRAVDLGVTFFDTALAYGDGHSEQLVGQVVRERDEPIVVATKIPPKNMPGRRQRASIPTRRSRPTTCASAPSAACVTSGSTRSTSSSSTSGPTIGSAAALAGRDRGAQVRGQDPRVRRVDQRPPAGERESS